VKEDSAIEIEELRESLIMPAVTVYVPMPQGAAVPGQPTTSQVQPPPSTPTR